MDGFNYTGMGNSTNKKDAQSNAARDFVNYLVRVGEMSAAEVPALGVRKQFLFLQTLPGLYKYKTQFHCKQTLFVCCPSLRGNGGFCLQVSFPVGDQPAGGMGGGGGNGNLPPGGPLPPHLVVKEEKGRTCSLDSCRLKTYFTV